MTRIPPDTQKILETLRQVAAATLERKRRLGHYAVIWRNGNPMAIGEDAPTDYTRDRQAWVDQTSLDDILTSMKQRREDDVEQYDEIIE
jgi:hypothetical protein